MGQERGEGGGCEGRGIVREQWKDLSGEGMERVKRGVIREWDAKGEERESSFMM